MPEQRVTEYLKGLREVSLEGLRLIGKGSCGTVYELDPDKIIKVYDAHPENPERAGAEARISTEAYERGLPTVRCWETVRCGPFAATIYEKATGDSGEDILKNHPERAEELAMLFAGLGRQLHRTEAPADLFADAREKLGIGKAPQMLSTWLTEEQVQQWVTLILAIPDSGTMVHTDYHLGNVMFRGDQMVLIDVGALSHGHPMLDLVSMYLAAYEPQFSKVQLPQQVNQRILTSFLKAYFGNALTAEKEPRLMEMLRFLAALPYTPVLCSAMQPGACDPTVETWIRSKLDLVLSVSPEQLAREFAWADRELYQTNHTGSKR